MSTLTPPAAQAAASAEDVRPALFVEAQFQSGTSRLWTGYGEITWGGHVWTGGGHLLGISAMEQTAEVKARGAVLSLSGIPLDLISLALTEARQGDVGRVYLGFFDTNWQLVADTDHIFAGLLDVPQIEESGESATVTITYESQLIDLQRPREWRYTHESQQALHPGDRGFEYVTKIQDVDIKWGR